MTCSVLIKKPVNDGLYTDCSVRIVCNHPDSIDRIHRISQLIRFINKVINHLEKIEMGKSKVKVAFIKKMISEEAYIRTGGIIDISIRKHKRLIELAKLKIDYKNRKSSGC